MITIQDFITEQRREIAPMSAQVRAGAETVLENLERIAHLLAPEKPEKTEQMNLTVRQAAARANVFYRTVYRWINAGLIAANYTPTGGVRIHESELARVMAAGKITTAESNRKAEAAE